MFGPAFLVSPVLEGGATNWPVYLPKTDGGWIDFWTGDKMAGGQTVKAAAPLGQIPLHVRAGSILPLGPEEQYTSQKPASSIELRIYPGANGKFTLYEDEGVNYNYEKGEYTTIPFTWNDKTKTLIIGQRQGQFPGMLQERVFHLVLGHPGHGGGIEPCEESDREVRYSGEAVRVKLAK
jgi:alpha-D-xyloside xylohydrolase